jgi:hypothetical protein
MGGTPMAGLQVSATGTASSATVDAAGRFILSNVPAGDVELRFTGSGVDARLGVGTVAPGAAVEVRVIVNGSAADLDESENSHDGQTEIEGRVTSVPPLTAAGQFIVLGKTVTTNSATTFKLNGKDGSIADVIAGVRVHVKGSVSGTSVVATEVNIQNPNTTLPVDVNGEISALAGTATAFTFDIGSRHIAGTSATSFNGQRGFADLHNGGHVNVKGTQTNGVVIATRIEISGS